MLSRFCSPDLELLSIKCRPHFLPWNIHRPSSQRSTSHHRRVQSTLSDWCKDLNFFHQHINFATSGINTLCHCYMSFKNSYRAESPSVIRKNDQNTHTAVWKHGQLYSSSQQCNTKLMVDRPPNIILHARTNIFSKSPKYNSCSCNFGKWPLGSTKSVC